MLGCRVTHGVRSGSSPGRAANRPYALHVIAGLDPAIYAVGMSAWTTGSSPVVTRVGWAKAPRGPRNIAGTAKIAA